MLLPTEVSKGAGFRKIRALVAEGESPVGFSVTNFLRDQNFEVQRASTGEETVRAIRRGVVSFLPFDLLVLEDNVPGWETPLETTRKKAGGRTLKTILITSKPSNAVFDNIPGVDIAICRPVTAESLTAVLARTLVGWSARPAGFATPKRILIVEDDGLSLELMKILLTKNGYDVLLAANGTEAIEACKQNEVDLIFMDLQMPDMDGFTTATKIRETEKNGRHVPIVALTASNLSGKAYENLHSEFARFLTKPFQIHVILNVIQEFTDGQVVAPDEKPESSGDSTRVIEIQQALPRFDLDLERFLEIFAEYEASLSGRLAEMEQAFQQCDWPLLGRRAHNLKGISANVGAMQIAKASARLEDAGDGMEIHHIREVLDQVHAAVDALQAQSKDAFAEFFSINLPVTREK